VCLCGRCHRAVHAKKLHIEGDADVHLRITLRPPTRVGAGAG
jgi:hypothetical protein